MDARGLNRKVAELLGYKVVKGADEDGAYTVLTSPTGEEITFTRFWGDAYDATESVWNSFTAPVYRDLFTNAPRWATGDAAALRLLDTLPKNAWSRMSKRTHDGVLWACTIEDFDTLRMGHATAETLALAITNAFIAYREWISPNEELDDNGVFEETVTDDDDADENEDFWNSDCGIDDIEDDTRVCNRDGSEFCQLHCKWHYMLTEKSDLTD